MSAKMYFKSYTIGKQLGKTFLLYHMNLNLIPILTVNKLFYNKIRKCCANIDELNLLYEDINDECYYYG